jgi:hypothetical protein
MTPHRLADGYLLFGGSQFLQTSANFYQAIWCHISEDNILEEKMPLDDDAIIYILKRNTVFWVVTRC